MDVFAVARAVRLLVVNASGIDPTQELRIDGMDFDPTGKKLWVAEYIIPGDTGRTTNFRVSNAGMIMEYDFHTPAGGNTRRIGEAAEAVCNALSIGSRVEVENCACFVERLRREISFTQEWNTIKLVITLNVSAEG